MATSAQPQPQQPEPTSTAHSVTVKMLDRKHPEWALRTDQWERLRLLYEGSVEFANNGDQFVPRRPKEMYDVYFERQRRLTYKNLLQACIGWYKAKLFQNDPQIKFGQGSATTSDKRWTAFLQDCDKCGTTFIDFTRQLFETMMLYRRAFVLIDKPKADPTMPINTRADEQSLGLDQPYVVIYDPQKVFNWQLDKYGNILWIIVKTVEESQEDPFGKSTRIAHWWVFDKTTFWHYRFIGPKTDERQLDMFWKDSVIDQDSALPELVDAGPHVMAQFSQVPIRCCELSMDLWFANRTYLQIMEHTDQYNGFNWKMFMSNYPQLVIQTNLELKGVTKSEVSFIKLDPNDKISYLEPDGKSLEISRAQLMDLVQEIYRGWNLQAQAKQSTATADGASGYSKEVEMAPAIDMLAALGDDLRADMQNLLVDYKKCAGMAYQDGALPDVNGFRFETKSILGAIDVAQSVEDLGVTDKSPTLEKFLDKQVCITVMDGADEIDKEAALDEIENAPTRSEQKTADQQAQQQVFEQRFQHATATGVIQGEQSAGAA
jgi:hypothetical protein